jgi:hypothetical protein
MGRQIVTASGKDKPRFGGNEYPRPHARDQIFVVDSLESWVDIDIDAFEPLHTTAQDWKKHPIRGIIRKKIKNDTGEDATEEQVETALPVFIKRFQHFNPFVIRAFSEGHSAEKVLSGKKSDFEKYQLVFICLIIMVGLILIVYMLFAR